MREAEVAEGGQGGHPARLEERNPGKIQNQWSYSIIVLGGAATCFEGFVICFLKVPLACLGSVAAAVQPNSLGTLGKHFTKPLEQVAAQPRSLRFIAEAINFDRDGEQRGRRVFLDGTLSFTFTSVVSSSSFPVPSRSESPC